MRVSKKLLLALIMILLLILCFYKIQWTMIFTMLQTMTGIQLLALFSLLYIVSNLLLFPTGLPLNLLAGILWGTFIGGLLINVLATLAAALSFVIARSFGATFIEKRLNHYTGLRNFKKTINHYDWQFIVMIRINPIIPFCLSSYVFGLIPDLSFRHYILATVIANMLPSFAFASIGSVFKTISLTHANPNIKNWIINIGIALLLLSGTWLLKKYYTINQDLLAQEKETI